MKIKNKRLLTLLVLCVSLPVSFAYVMGPDDRVEVPEQQSPLAAVRQTGMIRIQGEEFVSGLLTGKNCDVVISAGHAAIYWQSIARKGWRKGELRGQGKFRFNLNPKSGADWYSMTLVNSGYEQAVNVGKDEHDWSIFRFHARQRAVHFPVCRYQRLPFTHLSQLNASKGRKAYRKTHKIPDIKRDFPDTFVSESCIADMSCG